jgi:hypothetical protein
MAFLDNSGDIILDAVLTDVGRKRLAAGNGSFSVSKFALGDDEVDYSLYRNSNSTEGSHPSGSAYYDLNILQTPVLEAFTNSSSILKSRLVSYSQPDLLYLPVIKNNDKVSPTVDKATSSITANGGIPEGGYLVGVGRTTCDPSTFKSTADKVSPFRTRTGLICGDRGFALDGQFVCLDQGLDNTTLSPAALLGQSESGLVETQYMVEIDNRLAQVLSLDGTAVARPTFVDDDNIASYFFSLNLNQNYFAKPRGNAIIEPFDVVADRENPANTFSVIGDSNGGRYGTRFGFRLLASQDIVTSNVLFTKVGGTTASDYVEAGSGITFRFIDSTIRITGFTTGFRVDIPVRFLKKT